MPPVQSGTRTPHGRELAMLAAHVKRGRRVLWLYTIAEVVGSWCGHCSKGRFAQAELLAYLATIPTYAKRRKVLEHLLRTTEHVERHGSMWRVNGAGGFVGHQHEWVPKLIEILDPETGELTQVESPELERRHCPANRQINRAGGLSPREQRSPHTLHVYRAHLREGGILGSKRPPAHAPDAKLSKKPRTPDGRWAYAHHWLRFPPPPAMVDRWIARAKRRKARVRVTRAPGPFTLARPPRAHELHALGEVAERTH